MTENFLIQYLRDSGFTGSIENGTAIHDLLIKPASLLYDLFKSDVDKAYAYLSLAKATDMQSTLGTTEYDKAVDCILSNWFVTRSTGQTTSGVIRAYFSKPQTSIYIATSLVFTVNDVQLYPTEGKLYLVSDFVTYYNTIRNITEYYIDIPVESVTSTSKAITTTDVVVCVINNIYYTRAEVTCNFNTGKGIETSEEFIARTQEVITTRELVSERALTTVLLDSFPHIKRLYIAGFGSDEQIRDLVETASGIVTHVGNKVDVYIQTDLVKKTLIGYTSTLTLDYVKILSVIDNVTKLNVAYTTNDTGIVVTGSSNYTVTYLQSADLVNVKNYLAGEGSVACCDIKVCYPTVRVLNIAITVRVSSLTIVPANVKKSIATYINNLEHIVNYSVLDMISNIKSDVPQVIDVTFPIVVTNNGVAFTGSTSNIEQLYTDDNYITVTVIQ